MKTYKNAGFWIRLLATWIDFLLLFIVLKLVYYLLQILPLNVYIPFEFTLLIFGIVYSAFSIGLTGKTFGKWLLNIEVLNKNNNKLSFFRALFRESILKIISGVFFFLGFFWIAFTRSKRGWHDYIAGTKVLVLKSNSLLNRIIKSLTIISLIIVLGSFLSEMIYWWNYGRSMRLTNEVSHPYHSRNISELKEISLLTPSDYSLITNWLKVNGNTPEEYVIETTSKYSVTIFGEIHNKRTNLDFLNKIIPDLYFKSGIRCIAMEAIPASMNDDIQKLVSARYYDENLALKIARCHGWPDWGYQGYWDVFKTVWELNKNLSGKEIPMRIVGIDSDWNGPAFSLMGMGDDGMEDVPFWEKFRVLTFIGDFTKLVHRDEIMAQNVVKEIIEKGDKGIVWIGTNHSYIHYGQPVYYNKKVVRENNRMGVMLSTKYKNKVFQIVIHSDISNSKNIDSLFIKSVDDQRLAPIGFCTKESPFAYLRDSCNDLFRYQPKVAFSDIAPGYIYFKSQGKLENCRWTDNYVSKEMFIKYKPYYEAKYKHKFESANAINNFMKEKQSNP